jgi:hypothetical protein
VRVLAGWDGMRRFLFFFFFFFFFLLCGDKGGFSFSSSVCALPTYFCLG